MLSEIKEELEALIPELSKETNLHTTFIRSLYRKFDRKLGLYGGELPITFGYETETLGSFTARSEHEDEQFHFSLAFIGYALKNPMSKEDRLDLYKHEYAHYMVEHVSIPEEYAKDRTPHGSAWKYCCSLIGAAPGQGYFPGKGNEKHDYKKALEKKPVYTDTGLANYRLRKEQEKESNKTVRFLTGDTIKHPKFGTGTIIKIDATGPSVRLICDFNGAEKAIDQKWYLDYARKNFL